VAQRQGATRGKGAGAHGFQNFERCRFAPRDSDDSRRPDNRISKTETLAVNRPAIGTLTRCTRR
jgi:hypothetical protein